MADWSQLPDDLLRVIIKCIASSLSTYLNFSAVCRSWRWIALENRHCIPCQFPGLMIPGSNEEKGTRDFYILSKKRVFKRQIPVPHSMASRGSIGGWIATTDESLNMHLFNPFTELQVQLPSIMTFPNSDTAGMPYSSCYVSRTAFSTSIIPTSTVSNGDCVAMTIYGSPRRLAFARPGDKAWTPIECRYYFDDLIFYRGQFYAVSCLGIVVVCDVGANPKGTLIGAEPPLETHPGPRYLVESSGQLLQVLRDRDWESTVNNCGEMICLPYEPFDFDVFKLDMSGPKWKWVMVDCIGDRMLFIGYTSFSLSALDFPGFRGNCIYFTYDYLEAERKEYSFAGSDMGIFDIENGSVQQLYPIDSQSTFPAPVWITHIPW